MLVGPGVSAFNPHSPGARAISTLFGQTLVVCGIIGAVVAGLVGVCIVRFRASRQPAEPAQTHGHRTLEIAWTIAPLVIVVGLLVMAARAMAASDPPADRDPDVVVIGHQWWWEARYASGAITANEIHIPAGKALLVRVESADVVHDFWVPQLGRKIDAVPGRPTSVWIEADEPGEYAGACAEYCGTQHAWMRLLVVAQTPADFLAWEEHQREPALAVKGGAATRGEAAFHAKTCTVCHAVGDAAAHEARTGLTAAPDLTHFAERTTIGAGVAKNDPPELARWLRDPQAVKPGSHMPDLNLSDEQVSDLTTYLESLR